MNEQGLFLAVVGFIVTIGFVRAAVVGAALASRAPDGTRIVHEGKTWVRVRGRWTHGGRPGGVQQHFILNDIYRGLSNGEAQESHETLE